MRKSAIRPRLGLRARMEQTGTRFIEQISGLAEREPDEVPPELTPRVEGRSGDAGDPDFAHVPLRECDVIIETERADVAEHVIRALRGVRAEPRRIEDPHEVIATGTVVDR